MTQSRFRPFVALLTALALSSCSDAGAPGLTAPIDAAVASSHGSSRDPVTTGTLDPAALDLKVVWWKKHQRSFISVTRTIDASGGKISIPETGFEMSFPAGAVAGSIDITVTVDPKYVAYKMEPAGTQFEQDVTVTQSLTNTTLQDAPLRSQLYAAYVADDNAKLSGKIQVLEIEPSTTIFSLISPLVPEKQVWTIRHFSRYMLASG
ncbi:MAG: hypothetical protein ABR585_13465 [Gemmatimonadaceae bacterium]